MVSHPAKPVWRHACLLPWLRLCTAMQGGQWLSSTTRHVRIYVGYVDPTNMMMDQSQADKLSLMLDPDKEFLWPEDKVQKIYTKFQELVDTYAVSSGTRTLDAYKVKSGLGLLRSWAVVSRDWQQGKESLELWKL